MRGYHCDGDIYLFDPTTGVLSYKVGSFVWEVEGTAKSTYAFYPRDGSPQINNIVNREGVVLKFQDTEILYVCFSDYHLKTKMVVELILDYNKDMVSELTQKLVIFNKSIDSLYSILQMALKEE